MGLAQTAWDSGSWRTHCVRPRRWSDLVELCSAGWSQKESYVPAAKAGCLLTCRSRFHEEMFWGAIGFQKNVASEPEKDRNRSSRIDSFINSQNAASAAAEKGTRTKKIPGKNLLDTSASFRDVPQKQITAVSNRRFSEHLAPEISLFSFRNQISLGNNQHLYVFLDW